MTVEEVMILLNTCHRYILPVAKMIRLNYPTYESARWSKNGQVIATGWRNAHACCITIMIDPDPRPRERFRADEARALWDCHVDRATLNRT